MVASTNTMYLTWNVTETESFLTNSNFEKPKKTQTLQPQNISHFKYNT